jgi:hypothetical protein
MRAALTQSGGAEPPVKEFRERGDSGGRGKTENGEETNAFLLLSLSQILSKEETIMEFAISIQPPDVRGKTLWLPKTTASQRVS